MRIIGARCIRQAKTMNRTGIDAYPAGHAGLFIKPRSLPLGFLNHWTDNTEGISHRVYRTYPPAGAAFNTQITGNDMKCIFVSLYCINRAQSPACTAAVARFHDSIRHFHHHGAPALPYSPQSACLSEAPTRIADNNRLSSFPCPWFFPGSLLPPVKVSR